ncbi:Ribonuclease P protein subunit p14 [Coemansia guatemalensis]|uniref:Ribonuclease P protein subunit p14 n=1 Tax=Coemansia guatemalensis TaxID=2761395 RepID=A0A9W8LT92_9FUNG|nr:Ribonuclease P protein subunit p14 [Coemansia guatemalensis]
MDIDIDQHHLSAEPAATFRTTISKQEFYYFSICLVTSDTTAIDPPQYLSYLEMVISRLHGAIGGGIPVDLINYEYPRAMIRVPFSKHKAVWQAMTIVPFRLLSDVDAHFQVLRGSAFAMGVSASSRKDPTFIAV